MSHKKIRKTDSSAHCYRLNFPNTCISLLSDTGNQIFTEAFPSGHMATYLALSSNSLTQDYGLCGPTSLVMALNALGMDPGHIWKYPYRWYTEDTLSPWLDLSVVKHSGMTAEELVYVAVMTGLKAKFVCIEPQTTEEELKQAISNYSKSSDTVLLLNYDRRTLNLKGGGHISPLGGYNPKRNLLLIQDTARFKYPPHWIPLSLMLAAMKTVDSVSGRCRGYILLQRPDNTKPLLFGISRGSALVDERGQLSQNSLSKFLHSWHDWLRSPSCTTQTLTWQILIGRLDDSLQALKPEEHILTTEVTFSCSRVSHSEHDCPLAELIHILHTSPLYDHVSHHTCADSKACGLTKAGQAIEMDWNRKHQSSKNRERTCYQQFSDQIDVHLFVVILLLAWPYPQSSGTMGSQAWKLVQKAELASRTVTQEIIKLRTQLMNLMAP